LREPGRGVHGEQMNEAYGVVAWNDENGSKKIRRITLSEPRAALLFLSTTRLQKSK
jgi:hypothetical protein